ncbi:MarR family winged helix-turn-helix transcriptional regulator [Kineococcus terrestris]|uniref:MarR family winged helix-turn-helix transcriptional regulator n=1 Tax=Kineococcus terrestris TaxID=2044856 RepID=UPI0034DB24FA
MDDEPRWLTPEQLDQWVHFVAVLTTVPAVVADQLKRDADLNFFEYHVLARLSGAPGRALQMAVLADVTHGSQSRLSHAVRRLESAGWVTRRSCATASRAVEAVLTDAGFEKLRRAAPGHVAEARRVLVDALTPEELAQLRHLSRKVLAAAAPEVLEIVDDLLSR